MLFAHIRRVAEAGSAVIYITHRLAEVRIVADRVTILRDGEVRGVSSVDAISDDELLRLIIGRRLESAFPQKLDVSVNGRTVAGDQGPRRWRLHRYLAVRRTRRDRRRRRHRRQRPERTTARPRRARAIHRDGDDRRKVVQRFGPAREIGLHAARPAHRGTDDEPDRARERSRRGAAAVHPRSVRQPQAGGRARHPRAGIAEHADTWPRRADLGAVRRQPAEGGDGPLDALHTGDPRRRRADARRRCGSPFGDLPHPQVDLGERRASDRELVRRPRTARSVRPGDRRSRAVTASPSSSATTSPRRRSSTRRCEPSVASGRPRRTVRAGHRRP